MIDNELFICKNKDIYPPFKNGLYLEEFFFNRIMSSNFKTKRMFIPALWTNFQIEHWFNSKKDFMQQKLNDWIKQNPSENGYFTIVQYDDGCLLELPHNTIVYGACSGNIPIPLIYEDRENRLQNKKIYKSFDEKTILCSFIGSITHSVRTNLINEFNDDSDFVLDYENHWTPNINLDRQNKFINLTCNSKFALAPRGYGRSSFRFFEILKLGTIPIYIWDDIEWLPYKDVINYNKFSISVNINDICNIKNLILQIDENKYQEMLNEYDKVKQFFTMDGMYQYVIEHQQSD
jgi:hypothetical protein